MTEEFSAHLKLNRFHLVSQFRLVALTVRIRDQIAPKLVVLAQPSSGKAAAEGHTYTDAEAAEWTALDPLFGYSRHPHRGAGPPCRTGASVISVDGDGAVRRRRFIPTELGSLQNGS
ncbi:hypothetical protein GCM10009574_093420 [Streptomyces asiaticus]